MSETVLRRKLIEVALPLEAINEACRREKDKKTGTIRNVHKWFAPMAAPAWRALLFAAVVDDPGNDQERKELIDLIAQLVPNDGGVPSDEVLREARRRMVASSGGHLPTVFDPFCGGGSTLVEAQRLGFEALGSDLNPVAALISRTLVELLPQVTGKPPVTTNGQRLPGLEDGQLGGFFTDVRYYARAILAKVRTELDDIYPPSKAGESVVAWLWAHTFRCSNPACGAVTPLASSFWLMRRGAQGIWVHPVTRPDQSGVAFEINSGRGAPIKGTVDRTGAKCLVCAQMSTLEYVREQGRADRLGVQLMAVAVDRATGRLYLAPSAAHSAAAHIDPPPAAPDLKLPPKGLGFRVQLYGFRRFADLFTNRQLVLLGAFARAIADVPDQVRSNGGDEAYARAIASVLGLGLGKLARANSKQATWNARTTGSSKAEPAFSRQAIPMVWDFTEVNPFGDSVGSWLGQIEATCRGLTALPKRPPEGRVLACDARSASELLREPGLVATDPPYFAQIGYADLSDFFYIWLRQALVLTHPDLFSTIASPKQQELIADPARHDGDAVAAASYFMSGFAETFRGLAGAMRADLPMLIVYAHRQEDGGSDTDPLTAWDAMLSAIISAGLRIVGTWPVHATRAARQRSQSSNALASYIILICRPQRKEAVMGTRRDFLRALQADMPAAVLHLQRVNIAPVDLAQAAIGPGMAIFSKFSQILEPDGSAMRTATALSLINRVLDEILDEQVGELDPPTRFATAWFGQLGFQAGEYGSAETLLTAKATSAGALRDSAIAVLERGSVRLLRPEELATSSAADMCIWGLTQRLVHAYQIGGQSGAAEILRASDSGGEAARDLAYRLYNLCDRKGWAAEALPYNALVVSWPEIAKLAADGKHAAGQTVLELPQ